MRWLRPGDRLCYPPAAAAAAGNAVSLIFFRCPRV